MNTQKWHVLQKKDLLIIFVVLSTFEISYFSYISLPIKLFYILSQSGLIVYGMLNIWLRRKLGLSDALIVLFVLIELFSTISQHEEITELVLNTKLVLLLYISFRYYFRLKPETYLRIMSRYLFILTILNTVVAIVYYPKGLFYYDQFAPAFLVGADNTSTRIYIMAIAFCFANHAFERINKSEKMGVIPVLCLTNFTIYVFLRDVGNGKLCAIVFLLAYVVFQVLKVPAIKQSFRKIILGNYILFFLMVIWNKLEIFSFIIINILHRDLTLTTRTTIWEITLDKIQEHLFFGNGYMSGEQFESMLPSIIGINAHNTILMIAFIGGLMLSLVFFIILMDSTKKYDECVSNHSLWMVPISFLAMFLRSQVEGGDAAFLIAFAFLVSSITQYYLKCKAGLKN